jgi:exopolyphosphatase / guanosine-5'-triphosphate,3'-diphosphate pyrophosphatase
MSERNVGRAPGGPRAVAAIDIGSTSIRMAVAEILPEGGFRTLESLQQTVSLGKDSFTRGRIRNETIEQCVEALHSFRRVLGEYGVEAPEGVRAVATSAVREASNRDAFLDRLYIATDIPVDIVDESEVNRLTYLSIQPLLRRHEALRRGHLFAIEVGGGSTEALGLREGRVLFAHTYRLGSLRMREMLEDFRAPATRLGTLMDRQVQNATLQIQQAAPAAGRTRMLALGGEVRFAASRLVPGWEGRDAARVKFRDLEKFTQRILEQSVDDLVREIHCSYPEAETLGPALLTVLQLARHLGLKEVTVGEVSLRDGLLAELAMDESWNSELRDQIIHSAVELGKRYDFEQAHAEHVAHLADQLFEAMRDEHQLSARYQLILHVAALLHDIGSFISNRSHHKHSMYLIRNSDLFGIGSRDIHVASQVARYHRRALPQASHDEYQALDRKRRIAVSKLAAILRVADALDRGHARRIRSVRVQKVRGALILTAENVADCSLEQMALRQKGAMFEQVYGREVILRGSRTGGGA